jgi:hypothetical protein
VSLRVAHVEDADRYRRLRADARGSSSGAHKGARSRQADRAQVRVTRVSCSPERRAPNSAAARLLEARKSQYRGLPQPSTASRDTRQGSPLVSPTRRLWKAAVSCVATRLQPELPCDAGASQPVVAGTRGGKCPPSVAARPTPESDEQSRAPAGRDRRPTDAARAPVSLPRPR